MKLQRNCQSAFTILEILFGLTIFGVMLFMIVDFMFRTNVEVGTVTNQSIANERCNIVLMAITQDVRSAKRGTFQFPTQSDTSAFGFMKYILPEDDDQTDRIAVEKIVYSFNPTKQTITRFATPMKFDKGDFTKDGKATERIYDNYSSFEVHPLSDDGSLAKIDTIGIKVASAVQDGSINHAQTQVAHTIVSVRDQNYFEKQPHWNENALYTSSLVSVTRGARQLPDFSDFTKAITWVKDLDEQIPGMINQIGTDIFDTARQQLATEIFNKTDELKREFFARSSVQSVVKKAHSRIVEKMYKSMGKKKEFAVAATFLRDFVYEGGKGPDVFKKVMEKKLVTADVKKIMTEAGMGFFGWTRWGVPHVSEAEFTFLDEFNREPAPSNSEKNRAKAIKAKVDATISQIYKAVGKEKDFHNFLGAWCKIMTDEVTDEIRGKALTYVEDPVVEKIVDQVGGISAKSFKDNLGLDEALKSNTMDTKVRNELTQIVGGLDLDVAKSIKGIKDVIKLEIKTGEARSLGDLTDATSSSISDAKKRGESRVKNLDVRRISNGMKDMPDPVSAAIINVSDQLLMGKVYDAGKSEFVQDKNATNYIDKLWEDFGLKPPSAQEY